MSAPDNSPKIPISAEQIRQAISLDWFALKNRIGIGALKDRVGAMDPDVVSKAIAGETAPRLHTALNSLRGDPAALLNTLLLFGVVVVPVEAGDVEDNAIIIGMLRAATDYCERMKDGVRDHRDTLALAELFTPLVPAMLSIIREAAEIRGGRG